MWCFGAFNGISPMSASYYFSAACHLYDAFLAEYADSTCTAGDTKYR